MSINKDLRITIKTDTDLQQSFKPKTTASTLYETAKKRFTGFFTSPQQPAIKLLETQTPTPPKAKKVYKSAIRPGSKQQIKDRVLTVTQAEPKKNTETLAEPATQASTQTKPKEDGQEYRSIPSSLPLPEQTVTTSSIQPTLSKDPDLLSAKQKNALRAKRLLDRALQSKPIAALYEQICSMSSTCYQGSGSWQVIISDTLRDVGARCCPSLRKIEIFSGCSDDEALSYLIFELLNAANEPKFAEIEKLARENSIGRESYAFDLETIEHETLCTHRQIINEVIAEMGYGINLHHWIHRENPNKDISFQEYWKIAKDTNHTEFYRKQWDKIKRKYHKSA